jgi:hypothetical protein
VATTKRTPAGVLFEQPGEPTGTVPHVAAALRVFGIILDPAAEDAPRALASSPWRPYNQGTRPCTSCRANQMTGRDLLNKHARRVRLVNVVITVMLIGSVFAAIRYPVVFWVGVLLVGLMQVVVRQPAASAIRCPWCCRAALGPLLDRRLRTDGVRYCPSCGISMDEEVGTGGTTKKVAVVDELA